MSSTATPQSQDQCLNQRQGPEDFLQQSKVWRQLFGLFYQPQKNLFHRVILLALITAGTEAAFTLVTKWIVDEVVAHGRDASLWGYVALYFGLIALLIACIRLFILYAGLLSNNLMYTLRKRSFEHLQSLSFSFYDQNAVGWLVARITSDCARISRLIAWGTLDIFWGVPYILGIFAVLFVLNAKLAALILLLFPALAWVSYKFNRWILDSSRQVRRTNSRLTAVYNESIAGVQTSQILVREQQNLAEFRHDSRRMHRQSMHNLLLSSAFFPIVTLFVAAGTGIALWSGGYQVIGGVMTLGTLIAFITYSRVLTDPVLEVAQVLTNLQRTTACAERVMGLWAVEPEIKDSAAVLARIHQQQLAAEQAEAQYKPESDGAAPDGGDSKIRALEFSNVSFGYKDDEPVLKNFSYQIPAGSTVALVGPTGSGKSTIVSLLCRFYEPTRGEVRINGTDYRQRSLDWWQSNLGIVLQTPFLFSGSVRSNIRYGKLDASDDEVIAAAKAVSLHEIIMQMEHGYDTVIQEGGNNLSTGQKQLISFARAIIGNPQLLVMDEATSSVDTHTEHLLQQGLSAVLRDRTSFVIAHRLSTIRDADHILVIEQGELQEAGTHQQLLAARGKYFELYRKQFTQQQESALLHQ